MEKRRWVESILIIGVIIYIAICCYDWKNEKTRKGEEFRTYLTYAIIEKQEYFQNYYDIIIFLQVDDDLKEVEKKYQKKWDIIEEKVIETFSDDDIANLSITEYDPYERGGIILSILAYNYDEKENAFYNKDEMLDICKGKSIYYYYDVVKEIPKRYVNQYSREKYGKTYEEILEEETIEYEEFMSQVGELEMELYEYDSSNPNEVLDIRQIITTGSDLYHQAANGYQVKEFDELSSDLRENPIVQEFYKKYNELWTVYEEKPAVKKFFDCKQKEEEFQEKLYEYNLKNPKCINDLCKLLSEKEVDTFEVTKMASYFSETEYFERLVDEYLGFYS